ncbi:alkaline phosphatase family protein [Thermodesulfobacteriota bacterium]
MAKNHKKVNRREFLKQSTIAVAAVATGLDIKPIYAARKKPNPNNSTKKVIVIGIDGMDPRLSEEMMNVGKLPNFDKLRKLGGYKPLGTSIPPQSPVAWANFINGSGPGSHGIYDFIHRNPKEPSSLFFSAAETLPGEGYWEIGEHKLQLNFWPFNHKQSTTLLRRKGIPFWDYLDEAGVRSVFYDLPANYPPSPSKYGNHRCLSGMGTPDMLGTYGTYQYFAEDGPMPTRNDGGGMRSKISFENETGKAKLIGPRNEFLKEPEPATIDFIVHRDGRSRSVLIEIQNHKILLKEGHWSRWINVSFELSMPAFLPNRNLSAICRFYLQEVEPNFRLYTTPINIDPSDPAIHISEPNRFIKEISNELGLFYTTGFQEDHKALSNKIFTDDEFVAQADLVLKERLDLLRYAIEHYDDGLLFFYFSSADLQSHMFWWDSSEKHPTRSAEEAKRYFDHLKDIYREMDDAIGKILKRYGDDATIIVMSDHGFARFKRQFNLNTWLRNNGYVQPASSTSILYDVDWKRTKAYGLGINSLYLNLKGRERDGIVEHGNEREELIEELIRGLEAVRDIDGRRVIRKVRRTDKSYSGALTDAAPDLIVGYHRRYRASWATCLGHITDEVLSDNDSAWSADHCADVLEVPGVIFSNRPISAIAPELIDIAPSILTEFGLEVPLSMEGKNIFAI